MKHLIAGTVLLGAASLSRGSRSVPVGEWEPFPGKDYRAWDESAIKAREHYNTRSDYLFTAPVVRMIGYPHSPKNEFRIDTEPKIRDGRKFFAAYRYSDNEGGNPRWSRVLLIPEDLIEYL